MQWPKLKERQRLVENMKLEIGNLKLSCRGMSLMEVLVALAMLLILISALSGVGSGIKTRALADHTKDIL